MYENGTLINEFCATYEIEYQIQNTRLVNPENIICIWKIIKLIGQLTEKGIFNFAFELGLALCQKS